jgi:hypothetical protein
MPAQIGSFNVPVYTTLPASGLTGQYVCVGTQIYNWDGTQWVTMWPLFIQATQPTSSSTKWLWVNTSGGAGTNATLFVQDGT